jgi:hypothetical protein
VFVVADAGPVRDIARRRAVTLTGGAYVSSDGLRGYRINNSTTGQVLSVASVSGYGNTFFCDFRFHQAADATVFPRIFDSTLGNAAWMRVDEDQIQVSFSASSQTFNWFSSNLTQVSRHQFIVAEQPTESLGRAIMLRASPAGVMGGPDGTKAQDGAGTPVTGAETMYLGNTQGLNRGSDITFYRFAMWSRELTLAELRWFAKAGQWEMYRPTRSRRIFVGIAGGGGQTISDAGNIASAEAFGSAVVSAGTVSITGAGAIGTAEAFGSTTVTPGAVTITGAGAIASEEAFGSAVVSAGTTVVTGVGAIASAEAFGTAQLDLGVTGAGAIASAETFGDTVVSQGQIVVSGVGNIATAEAFGTATLVPGAVSITGTVGAIASAEAFGTAQLDLDVSGAGDIATAEAFGSSTVSVGTATISGVGNIGSAEQFGSTTLTGGVSTFILTGRRFVDRGDRTFRATIRRGDE